jgi:ketosteroid isomerase-like protein
MKTRIIILIFVGFFTYFGAYAQTPWQLLVGTEQAFAKEAQNSTVKNAFLTYLADSSQVYDKGAWVPGKKHWQAQTFAGQMVWGPEYAMASADGDIGFTAGPWEQEKNGTTSKGYYNSVWRRLPDGNFLALIDIATEYPAVNIRIPAQASTPIIPTEKSTATTADLLSIDASLSKSIRRKGPGTAYVEIMSEEVRLFRPGRSPLVDKNWILSYLTKEAKYDFEPTKAYVAESGDVGYVLGTLSGKHKGVYLRIWKNEARFGWRLATEVLNYEE